MAPVPITAARMRRPASGVDGDMGVISTPPTNDRTTGWSAAHRERGMQQALSLQQQRMRPPQARSTHPPSSAAPRALSRRRTPIPRASSFETPVAGLSPGGDTLPSAHHLITARAAARRVRRPFPIGTWTP
ncbi:hypothetical protein ALMP_82240 [Streptomyces sp. A012304]|nr:hypothetical protein ALMP_82240 [Streptomyces sp. A012304]